MDTSREIFQLVGDTSGKFARRGAQRGTPFASTAKLIAMGKKGDAGNGGGAVLSRDDQVSSTQDPPSRKKSAQGDDLFGKKVGVPDREIAKVTERTLAQGVPTPPDRSRSIFKPLLFACNFDHGTHDTHTLPASRRCKKKLFHTLLSLHLQFQEDEPVGNNKNTVAAVGIACACYAIVAWGFYSSHKQMVARLNEMQAEQVIDHVCPCTWIPCKWIDGGAKRERERERER